MDGLGGRKVIICTAADGGYFGLLEGLVRSLAAGPLTQGLPIGVLDLGGMTAEQTAWLTAHGAIMVQPGWDLDFPYRDQAPGHYRAMSARPHLPKYFPGYDLILWIDADAWVQDDQAILPLLRGAAAGKLAIVPEFDRGYWTQYKPPKLWGQNQKAFAWSYGLKAGYRLGRNPILNVGVFALAATAPHWRLWAEAHAQALNRRRLGGSFIGNFNFFLSEQTALNQVVFGQRQPVTLLPATYNWFCGKGTPMWDEAKAMLVEAHEPHLPLGIVHLAGKGMKERLWTLDTVQGHQVSCRLTYEEVARLRAATVPAKL